MSNAHLLPARFAVPFAKRTIANPAQNVEGSAVVRKYEGLAADYDFERQTANFKALKEVLEANGDQFQHVASLHYLGDVHTNHKFVATTQSGNLMWYKYVGFAAQSGQNHVFVSGYRIKVTVFLNLKPEEQRVLLSGTKAWIMLCFSDEQLKYMDESETLWN